MTGLIDSDWESLSEFVNEKAKAACQPGGVVTIQELITSIRILIERNKDILDQAEKILQEEKLSDDRFKAQYRDRWNREPSYVLTAGVTSNLSESRKQLESASKWDSIVIAKFENHRHEIRLPSRSQEELDKASKLQHLINRVYNLKSERRLLEQELKNMAHNSMEFHHQNFAKESSSSISRLDQLHDPIEKRVGLSIDMQSLVINEIQILYDELVKDKEEGKDPCAPIKLLKELATAQAIYVDIHQYLQASESFYQELTRRLLDIENGISTFCFTRNAEKNKLLKNLISF